MKGKIIGIKVVTLLIMALMVSVSATSIVDTEEKDIKVILKSIDLPAQSLTMKATEITPANVIDNDLFTADAIPLFEGLHPAIASAGTNVMMGFDTLDWSGTYFSTSPDGGSSWTDAGGWELGATEFPSISHWAGNRFIGTVTPDYTTSGEVSLLDFADCTDINTWLGATWDWSSYDFFDFLGTQFSAGDDSFEEWRIGFWTLSGYVGYNDYDNDECPLTQYPTDDGYATISWYDIEGCTHPANDMDKVEQLNYGVWEFYNESSDMHDLFIRVDPFNYDPEAGTNPMGFSIITGEDNLYPDVSAENDNVIITVEASGNVLCYYSTNGFSSFDVSTIETGAAAPRIVHIDDNEAICTYSKGGSLYSSLTTDGGATWSAGEVISDSEVLSGWHEYDVSPAGAIYGGTDDIVYFEPDIGGSAKPLITIDSISGGIGVSAVIKNLGDADATDVPYTMTATGGLLGMINKEVEGTIDVAAGGEETISTGIILGIGAVSITVQADLASETVEGTQILFFTMI